VLGKVLLARRRLLTACDSGFGQEATLGLNAQHIFTEIGTGEMIVEESLKSLEEIGK